MRFFWQFLEIHLFGSASVPLWYPEPKNLAQFQENRTGTEDIYIVVFYGFFLQYQ